MKKVRIYIASSAVLRADVTEIGDFFRSLNDCYLDRGLYFAMVTQKDAGGTSDCDLAFFLFCAETDEAVRRDFGAAQQYRGKNDKPNIVTYFKTESGVEQTDEASRLKDRLSRETGGYYNTYLHIDTLKLGILMQIRQLDLDGMDLRLEDGRVWQGGTALLELGNVEMVSGYEALELLKAGHAALEERFYAAKTRYAEDPDDDEAYEAFYEAAKLRGEAMQEIRDVEARLYHMIEGMYEQTARGKLSKRQIEGYRLVERGRIREAQAVLDFESIVSENRRNEAAATTADKRAQVHVNELLQLVSVNKTLGDWDGVDACYREAARTEERHRLPRNAMLAYISFLYDQTRYSDGIEHAKKICYWYQNPDAESSDADKASVYDALGLLYVRSNKFAEAEQAHETALNIRQKLAGGDPDTYEPDLASSYHNLGYLCYVNNRMNEAEELWIKAVELRRKLANRNPDAFLPALADSQNNLGVVYMNAFRTEEAGALLKSAMEIRKTLADAQPDVFSHALGNSYTNLGMLYSNVNDVGAALSQPRMPDAEDMLMRALEIYKKLVGENPSAYEYILSQIYANLGNVYNLLHRVPEMGRMMRAVLDIRKRLAARDPETYEPKLADCYIGVGSYYLESRKYVEAEEAYRQSIALRNKFVSRSPEVNEPFVALGYCSLGEVYQEAGRTREAKDAYLTALRLYEKYSDENTLFAERAANVREKMATLSDTPAAGPEQGLAALTPEEREVALLLTDGITQRDIARKLKLTASEVGGYVKAIRDKVAGAGSADPRIAAIAYAFKLSGRGAHILDCLSRGMTNAEIAAELFIAEETVRVHTHRLIKKLPVESRQDIAAWVGAYGDKTQ